VYVGHAAIALGLSRRETRLPVALLALAAFGPDWLEVVLMLPVKQQGSAIYTHSIPAVLLGAAAAAGLCAAMRRPGARIVFLAWLLHWPADLLTGRKPLLVREPLIGLDLYNLPAIDFLLESLIVVFGCAMYARAFPPRAELRRVVVILGAALIALQAAADVALSVMRDTEWTPSLSVSALAISSSSIPRSRRCRAPHAFCTSPSYTLHEDAMANDGVRGIVTLVCLTCGKEKFFTREVPAAVSCEQCGSTVFRTFATPTEPDEAAIDALEAQARSMAYGDSSPDTTPDDVRDLDMR
jgi:hypothetical protein